MGIATVIPDDGSPLFTIRLDESFFEGQTVIIDGDVVRPAADDEIPKRNNKERLKKLFNKNK